MDATETRHLVLLHRGVDVHMVFGAHRVHCVFVVRQFDLVYRTDGYVLGDQRTFAITSLGVKWNAASVEQRSTAILEEFLRVREMRFRQAHVSHLVREFWHKRIRLATRAIDSHALFEDMWRDLDDGNMVVSVQICAMLLDVPTNAVDVESNNA